MARRRGRLRPARRVRVQARPAASSAICTATTAAHFSFRSERLGRTVRAGPYHRPSGVPGRASAPPHGGSTSQDDVDDVIAMMRLNYDRIRPVRRRNPVARLIGINHVALEVGDIEEALAWYGRLFEIEVRGRTGRGWRSSTWATSSWPCPRAEVNRPTSARHFGLVVDDKEAVRARAPPGGRGCRSHPGSCDFKDPWGNFVQVVDYRDIQFTKAPAVAAAMSIEDLHKTPKALEDSASRGPAS